MLYRSKNFNYKFHYLLICFLILLYNSESKNIKLSLINSESQIKITFANIGENYFLSRYYNGYQLFSKLVNPPSNCNINTFLCDIKNNKKTITLNFDEKLKIHSCENMFEGLDNIEEIDLSNFDSSRVTNMAYMFANCTGLKKINFGNMNTSIVVNMKYFLHGCQNLESVDVSNFDTSSVTNMRYMFSSLYSLKSLKLSNNFKF